MKSNKNLSKSLKGGLSSAIIPVSLVASILVYAFVFGDGSHFIGGNNANLPNPGDYYGIVYKGGPIVPLIITLLLTVLAYSVERYLAITKASGKGRVVNFMTTINEFLNAGKIDSAKEACNDQKGSVANVIYSGLVKYQEMEREKALPKDQKIVSIQKEIEEATSLELPALEQNLVILSTIASVATLMGLLGTVIGMIKAFSALANAGAPDSVQLAAGISEALINTALGIGTSALAIIFYNFFTTKIDKLTYSIDEAGYTIVNTFASKNQ
ncbi:MAG: MotA/TolQ/ExbB proton channel family protein [Prolixibacteraceae bacterium]|nr:MotA/TolQ/ExbB proton channel family protein [Prolixibacteraceae bacterium]